MSELLIVNVADGAKNVDDEVLENVEIHVDDNAKDEDEKDKDIEDEAADNESLLVNVVVDLLNVVA